MTDDDIKALREALAAGPTEGPWRVGATDPLLFGVPRGNGSEPLGFVYGPSHGENSDFGRRALATCAYIAAASPDRIARLLDALKAEQDEVHRLQASHSALYGEVERLRAIARDSADAATEHQKEVLRLRAVALKHVVHAYEGDCPDELDRHRRDGNCPACQIMGAA
jgi:hypothetical protein